MIYSLLAGSGGQSFIVATGGTIFQQTVGPITYNVHRFDFEATHPGETYDF